MTCDFLLLLLLPREIFKVSPPPYVYVAEFQLNRYIAADLICHRLLNLLESVCDEFYSLLNISFIDIC